MSDKAIKKEDLNKAIKSMDEGIKNLFILWENEIVDKCSKTSTFALFGFRIKLMEEIQKIKNLTE